MTLLNVSFKLQNFCQRAAPVYKGVLPLQSSVSPSPPYRQHSALSRSNHGNHRQRVNPPPGYGNNKYLVTVQLLW